jgi:hypothetical protein
MRIARVARDIVADEEALQKLTACETVRLSLEAY